MDCLEAAILAPTFLSGLTHHVVYPLQMRPCLWADDEPPFPYHTSVVLAFAFPQEQAMVFRYIRLACEPLKNSNDFALALVAGVSP